METCGINEKKRSGPVGRPGLMFKENGGRHKCRTGMSGLPFNLVAQTFLPANISRADKDARPYRESMVVSPGGLIRNSNHVRAR